MLSRTVIERVLGERVSFLIEDAQRDAALQAQMSIVSQGLHTAMAAPLFDNQSVIGLLYADSADTADRYTTDELKAFTLLANCIAVALTHARYHTMEAEKQRLDTELGAARRIMATLLPAEAPAVPGWELLTHLESCTEVGGDLYDVFPLPDGRLAVVIGDVAGKGLGAALLVSSLLPLLRGLAGSIADLSDLVHRLNAVLFAATEPIRYATLFVGLLDPATGELAYVNAGHNPPYVVRGDGATEHADRDGPAGGADGRRRLEGRHGVARARRPAGPVHRRHPRGLERRRRGLRRRAPARPAGVPARPPGGRGARRRAGRREGLRGRGAHQRRRDAGAAAPPALIPGRLYVRPDPPSRGPAAPGIGPGR